LAEPTRVELNWKGGLLFEGQAADSGMVMDSDGKLGPSPVQALLLALAGCMAMDVASILSKARLDLRGIRARLVAERAEEPPRRVVKVGLHFTLTGDLDGEKVERAIALSREKYCSVWHSMRQDIPFATSFEVLKSS
jgi:putative redox protein